MFCNAHKMQIVNTCYLLHTIVQYSCALINKMTTDLKTKTHPSTQNCRKHNFATLYSNGRYQAPDEEKTLAEKSNRCIFISISDGLFSARGMFAHAEFLRELSRFPEESIMFYLSSNHGLMEDGPDDIGHDTCLQILCDLLRIGIYIFAVNSIPKTTSRWIANPSRIFLPTEGEPIVRIAIAAFCSLNNHYEFVCTPTDFTPDYRPSVYRKPELRDRVRNFQFTPAPSAQASEQASEQPGSKASKQASAQVSAQASAQVSAHASEQPGSKPSAQVSAHASEQPGSKPNEQPISKPNEQPGSKSGGDSAPVKVPVAKGNRPCKRGANCTYGAKCWYDHAQPPMSVTVTMSVAKAQPDVSVKASSTPPQPTYGQCKYGSKCNSAKCKYVHTQPPVSQPSAMPVSQPSATPVSQPSATPVSQPSATPGGHQGANPEDPRCAPNAGSDGRRHKRGGKRHGGKKAGRGTKSLADLADERAQLMVEREQTNEKITQHVSMYDVTRNTSDTQHEIECARLFAEKAHLQEEIDTLTALMLSM